MSAALPQNSGVSALVSHPSTLCGRTQQVVRWSLDGRTTGSLGVVETGEAAISERDSPFRDRLAREPDLTRDVASGDTVAMRSTMWARTR
jgi:hypothetical protein